MEVPLYSYNLIVIIYSHAIAHHMDNCNGLLAVHQTLYNLTAWASTQQLLYFYMF